MIGIKRNLKIPELQLFDEVLLLFILRLLEFELEEFPVVPRVLEPEAVLPLLVPLLVLLQFYTKKTYIINDP